MQPFSKFALAVLLAHLLGDFPLQTANIAQDKGRGTRAYLVHGAIHFFVLTLCIAVFVGVELLGSLRFWILAGIYIVVHLAIDRAKQGIMSRKLGNSMPVFVVDQTLHVCTIVLLSWFITRPGWPSLRSQFGWSPATGERILEAAIVYVAVVFAGGYLIRDLTRNLTAGIEMPGETPEQVKNAGMYIGWLERFLVVTAILVQSPSMVGLILTGKSIARFPELKERFAEYFLIGTLLSIGLAVLGGLVLAKLWYGTISLK
jgi:Protein of unknown function (DUF3307)